MVASFVLAELQKRAAVGVPFNHGARTSVWVRRGAGRGNGHSIRGHLFGRPPERGNTVPDRVKGLIAKPTQFPFRMDARASAPAAKTGGVLLYVEDFREEVSRSRAILDGNYGNYPTYL